MLYSYLIGCDNELAKLHTQHPEACDKVGGVIIMHIEDLRKFALLWLHKTEEVRADTAHYATNITGDIFASGWISEMYGYSFGAAEVLSLHIVVYHFGTFFTSIISSRAVLTINLEANRMTTVSLTIFSFFPYS